MREFKRSKIEGFIESIWLNESEWEAIYYDLEYRWFKYYAAILQCRRLTIYDAIGMSIFNGVIRSNNQVNDVKWQSKIEEYKKVFKKLYKEKKDPINKIINDYSADLKAELLTSELEKLSDKLIQQMEMLGDNKFDEEVDLLTEDFDFDAMLDRIKESRSYRRFPRQKVDIQRSFDTYKAIIYHIVTFEKVFSLKELDTVFNTSIELFKFKLDAIKKFPNHKTINGFLTNDWQIGDLIDDVISKSTPDFYKKLLDKLSAVVKNDSFNANENISIAQVFFGRAKSVLLNGIENSFKSTSASNCLLFLFEIYDELKDNEVSTSLVASKSPDLRRLKINFMAQYLMIDTKM